MGTADNAKGDMEQLVMGYDFIGDIHGHSGQLKALLATLGYVERNESWSHPDRTAVFVGDLIDRGPGQLETLRTVRTMVENGAALAVLGNHEFNAIAWHTEHPQRKGDYLRTRLGSKGAKNRAQHQVFLSEVGEDSTEHREWIEWLSRLPLWIEHPEFRVVHACWSPKHIQVLQPRLREGRYLTHSVLAEASEAGTEAYDAVEVLLKGPEVKLPSPLTFKDKEGHQRDAIRTQWWNPALRTFREAYIGPDGADIPDVLIPDYEPVPPPDRPTFIGHYWLPSAAPKAPVSDYVACLDYSVASGGPLVAYRFDGESILSRDRFIWSSARTLHRAA